MKKTVLFFILTSFIAQTFAQNKENYKIGDTIYFKNKVPTLKPKADYYSVTQAKVILNEKELYKMIGFKKLKDSSVFLKHSEYYTIDPNLISSEYKQINYHMNGTKSAEGYSSKGRKYGVWTYWYNNEQRKEVKRFFKSKALEKKVKDPEMISFWNREGVQTIKEGNGAYLFVKDSIIESGFYVKGFKHGKFERIEKNKKIYEEHFKGGKLISGKSWDDKGNEYTYKVTFEKPRYPGGQKAIQKHILKKLRIPEYAYYKNISGRVILRFVVNKDGRIGKINVIKSLCKPCDAEAIRVVKQLRKWKPGKIRGKKIRAQYVIPISFQI